MFNLCLTVYMYVVLIFLIFTSKKSIPKHSETHRRQCLYLKEVTVVFYALESRHLLECNFGLHLFNVVKLRSFLYRLSIIEHLNVLANIP